MKKQFTFEELEQKVWQLENENAALRKTEERLKLLSSITENMSDSVIATNADFQITYVNKKAEELFGYRLDELQGQSPDIFNAEPTAEQIQARLYETVSSGKVYYGEHLNKKRNGTKFLCGFKVFQLLADEGDTYTYVGIQRDITEQRRAIDVLRESEKKWRNILVNTPQIGLSLDKKGKITFANRHFLQLTGWSEREVIGHNWFELCIPSEIRNEIQTVFRSVMNGKGNLDLTTYENEILTCNGERRVVAWSNVLTRDLEGGIIDVTCLGVDLTERKRAEALLQESESRYRTIFENNLNPIAIIDNEGYYLEANQAFYKFTQTNSHTLLKRSVFEFSPPNRKEKQEEEHRPAWSSGGTFETEYLIGDQIKTLELSVTPIYYKGRKAIVGIGVDTTKRKKSEAALRESEEKFRALSSMLPQIVFETDSKFNLTFVNKNAFRTFLYTEEDFESGLNALQMISPSDQKMAAEMINTIMKGEADGIGNEYLAIKKDGTEFPVLIYSSLLFRNGIPAGIRGVMVDISERKLVEKKIKQSEEKFRSLYELSPQAIALTDIDSGEILDVNDKLCELTKYSREEIIGKTTTEVGFYNKKDRQIFVNELMASGQVNGLEMDFFAKNGSKLTALMFARPVKIMDESLLLTIFHNMTEQKLLQKNIARAQKLESVGRLAGGVAHDFNNMLGVIMGHTELALLQADENHDLYSDLKEIQNAAKRSADITKQLLAFARKQTISPKKIDLNDTVESMLNMLRRLIGEDIDLVWQPGVHLWLVKMDPSQFDQILVNLCVNARDAISGVGKLTIETGTKTFDEEYCNEHAGFIPGDFVLLVVSDTGSGMDKNTLDNLFEPFFTTKEVGKGTGLGLATVYGIVKQNNGFINVYSEPGQGSTFKIYLPRFVADDDSEKAVPEKKVAAVGFETILLVEDEPSILRMTRMMLERKGYSVLSAATPTEAVEKATNHSDSIDLLMTDVVMPEMNGRDLAEKLIELHPNIKLLFMSGYTADVIAHQGVLDDGVAFIQKPFSMADMTAKVREVLDTAPDKNQG